LTLRSTCIVCFQNFMNHLLKRQLYTGLGLFQKCICIKLDNYVFIAKVYSESITLKKNKYKLYVQSIYTFMVQLSQHISGLSIKGGTRYFYPIKMIIDNYIIHYSLLIMSLYLYAQDDWFKSLSHLVYKWYTFCRCDSPGTGHWKTYFLYIILVNIIHENCVSKWYILLQCSGTRTSIEIYKAVSHTCKKFLYLFFVFVYLFIYLFYSCVFNLGNDNW
jgi:hypothetical protein